METVFKTRPVNWFSGTVFGFLIGAVIFLMVAFLAYSKQNICVAAVCGLIGLFLLSGIPGLALINYHITDDGLLITRPILHRRLFRYADIQEVRKVSAGEASKLVVEANRKFEELKAQSSAPGQNVAEAMSSVAKASDYPALSQMYLSNPSVVSMTGMKGRSTVSVGGVSVTSAETAPTEIKASLTAGLVAMFVKSESGVVFPVLLEPADQDGFLAALTQRMGR
ncbi:hypothetical protein H0O00_04600 [Candidatus Micrarchaeota archaeon]|nr:hypothetical protein [Candidatus Micrarchaeota archaeon]